MGTKVGVRKKVKNDTKIESPVKKKPVKKRKMMNDDEEKKKKNEANKREKVGRKIESPVKKKPVKKRKMIKDDEEKKKKKPVKKRKMMNDDEEKKKNETNKREKVGRKFNTSCRPSSICKLVAKLNERQRRDVESIGFGGVLQFKSLSYIPWKLMNWFAFNFNPSSRVLAVGGNNDFVVTAEDFRDLFLIPLSGSVVSKTDDESSATFLVEFKARLAFGVCTTFEECKCKILGLIDGGEDFKRLFVLYVFSTFFSPTANRLIDFTLIKSLTKVEDIANRDWCSFALERLCRAVSSFRYEGKGSINGCAIVLPLLYFHRCKWQGFREPSTLPLIQHWTSTKIKERLIAEASADHVGQGEWIDGVYPISSRLEAPQAPQANDVEREDVEDIGKEHCVDGRCVILHIPTNEMTDIEIAQLAKDPMDEALLIFKRNFNLVSSAYIQRMKELSNNTNVQQERSNPSTSSGTATATAPDPATCTGTAPATATVHAPATDTEEFDEEFCKILDSMVVDFKLKRRMEKKAKKRFAEDDSFPKFDLFTPTPLSSDTTISLTPVEVAKEDVIESYTLPSTQEDGESWPLGDTSTLLSHFMRKYDRHLSILTQKEKSFVDYCFYEHLSKERENVFCHGGDSYVHIDAIKTLDEDLIVSTVIDAWSMIMNKTELEKAKKSSNRPLVHWFHSQHSLFLGRLHKAEEDDKLEHATEVRGCWSYYLEKLRRYMTDSERKKSIEDFFLLDRIFFPICYEKHFVAAVIDFEKKKVFYLDNRKNGSVHINSFWQLVSLVHQQFVIFLQDIKHPKADELNAYPVECPAFKWQNNNRNIDCGIFLMNHMQNFRGETYNCVELERAPTRRIFRAKYCAEIVLSPFNDLKKDLEANVIEFIRKMQK